MNFDMWRRWGIDLDDESFANAWIALGLVQRRRRWSTVISLDDLYRVEFSGSTLHWDFPSGDVEVEGKPEEWANAWRVVSERIPEPIQLRVYHAPPDEPILPWYRTLSEANPAPIAVSLAIEAPRAQVHIDWPLRLGCISENSWNVVEQVTRLWPSSNVAQSVRLDRITSNCDVLIQKTSARALLQELLQQAFGVKANIVVLQIGEEAWGEIEALLASVLALTRASGFILLPSIITDTDLANIINGLIEELAHDKPFDLALGTSISPTYRREVVAAFTPEIRRFVVHQLVERYNDRIMALPPGTTLDMSKVGGPNEWLTEGVRGGGIQGGELRSIAPPAADREVMAETVSIEEKKLVFEHESEGSSTLADVSRAVDDASVPPVEMAARAARFLQQQSFVWINSEFQEAKKGFISGVPTMIRVRIAAPEKGWDSLPSAFPVEKLPQHLESWKLTVWLSEPDHLPTGLKRQIKLPRDGNSTECEFHFRPSTFPRFNGRLTVLHRGRVIQTAVLRASVAPNADLLVDGGTPKLEELVAVRNRIGDLAERRQFDIAFVANHDEKGRPLLTALSKKAAWVKDLSDIASIAPSIHKSLLPVAKSVSDYADGLHGEEGRKLLVKLAQDGEYLKIYLEDQLRDPSNNLAIRESEYIQIVSTRSNAVVPLEFAYDYAVPDDDATVCPQWLDASKNHEQFDKCPSTCDQTSGRTVCPMGFWGLQKVIERHAVTPAHAKDGNEAYLQSEPTRKSDTLYLGDVAVLGSSDRVPKENLTELENLLSKSGLAPQFASNWDDWEKYVTEHRPSLLIVLPHTDGKERDATLEIGGKPRKSITLRETHVFPPPVAGRQAPLLALIGCDTAGTAADYGNHLVVLRARGAGIIIGTIATVFGEHAAKVAGKLVEGLLVRNSSEPVRLGELMRTIRRNSVRDGLLMPLCLVAYGDADWILSSGKANDV